MSDEYESLDRSGDYECVDGIFIIKSTSDQETKETDIRTDDEKKLEKKGKFSNNYLSHLIVIKMKIV